MLSEGELGYKFYIAVLDYISVYNVFQVTI